MRLRAIIVWAAIVLAPVGAGAQDSVAEARVSFAAALEAYEAGRFEDALRHFERAHELTGAPGLLYNIATVHDRLRNDRAALEVYQRYLASGLEDDVRANIERRIEVLQRALASHEAAPAHEGELAEGVLEEEGGEPEPEQTEAEARAAPAVDDTEPPESEAASDGDGPGAIPWVVASGGAALAVVGAVLLGLAQADIDAVRSGTSWATIRDAHGRIPALSGSGWALVGVGVAALVAGLTWGFTGDDGSEGGVALSPLGAVAWGRF